MKFSNGISINPSSEITGEQWIQKTRKSNNIPDYFKKQIQLRKNRITTPINFHYPKDVIPKTWLTDFLTAFNGYWEATTMHVDINIETQSEMFVKKTFHLPCRYRHTGKIT